MTLLPIAQGRGPPLGAGKHLSLAHGSEGRLLAGWWETGPLGHSHGQANMLGHGPGLPVLGPPGRATDEGQQGVSWQVLVGRQAAGILTGKEAGLGRGSDILIDTRIHIHTHVLTRVQTVSLEVIYI